MSRVISRAIALLLCALLAAPSLFAAGGGGGGGDADDPNKKTGPYKDAMDAIQAQRYAQAIPILEKWVAGHSNDADGFNWLGFAYRKTGQLDPAFKAYKRALGLDPQHKGAHEYIGEAYLQVGNLAKAKEHLAQLDKICYFGCSQFSDLKKAIAAYEQKPQAAR